MSAAWRRAREPALALAACLAASVFALRHLLRGDIVEGDALVHLYWMRQFRDPALFGDPLTALLRDSQRYPDAYVGLFRLASHAIDPVAFGEWLGIVLMALAGWLVFLVVRELSAWRPAPWLAAALFLALDGHRFAGGFPRGFLHAFVLLTVLLSLRGRVWAAAVVPAVAMLVYPPAALLAAGVLVFTLDRRRLAPVAAGVALTAVALVVVEALAGGAPDVLTRAQARVLPEFGAHGGLHFFVSSPIEYLRQNRSGFDLRATGCVMAVATLLALVPAVRARLLPRAVVALPVVALAAWAAAQAVLFRLYLPHRYTYPLLAFFAIVCAVALRPAWESARTGRRPVVAGAALLAAPAVAYVLGLAVFPLHPPPSAARLHSPWVLAALAAVAVGAVPLAALLRRRDAAGWGAALTGLALLAAVLASPGRHPPGQRCPATPASAYLASLPADAVIAGDPIDLKCVPLTARRAVLISTQLAYSYERSYLRRSRPRMFAALRAVYGHGAPAAALRPFGVTHLWVRRDRIAAELAGRGRWRADGRAPYGTFVRSLLRAGPPASLELPPACLRWRHGFDEVYDVACLGQARRRGDPPSPRPPKPAGITSGRAGPDHRQTGGTRTLSVGHRAQAPPRARRSPATPSRPATAR